MNFFNLGDYFRINFLKKSLCQCEAACGILAMRWKTSLCQISTTLIIVPKWSQRMEKWKLRQLFFIFCFFLPEDLLLNIAFCCFKLLGKILFSLKFPSIQDSRFLPNQLHFGIWLNWGKLINDMKNLLFLQAQHSFGP